MNRGSPVDQLAPTQTFGLDRLHRLRRDQPEAMEIRADRVTERQ
jgi:hypothetical protein